MNPWDILTWVAAVVLGASGILIFVFFLKDAARIIGKERDQDEEG